jgi:hypothetical protein
MKNFGFFFVIFWAVTFRLCNLFAQIMHRAFLRAYFTAYRPKEYLFEGQDGGQYSTRSIQAFFSGNMPKSRHQKESERTYFAA